MMNMKMPSNSFSSSSSLSNYSPGNVFITSTQIPLDTEDASPHEEETDDEEDDDDVENNHNHNNNVSRHFIH